MKVGRFSEPRAFRKSHLSHRSLIPSDTWDGEKTSYILVNLWSTHWYCYPINWVLTISPVRTVWVCWNPSPQSFFRCPTFRTPNGNNYFMNTLENEDFCNLMMYQVELEEFFGSSFPFWCGFAYLPLTAKAWIFLADWRMSYRSRQPGEVSYLLSMKIMPLVRKEHWNASSGNRELIFNMKAVFSKDLKIQWRFRRKRPSFFSIWSPNLFNFKEFIFEARGYRLPHFLWWNPGKIVPCHPKKYLGKYGCTWYQKQTV